MGGSQGEGLREDGCGLRRWPGALKVGAGAAALNKKLLVKMPLYARRGVIAMRRGIGDILYP
jgi:hypothetical protein